MRIAHVDTDAKVLVVAEVGNNHEGKVEAAREMVRRAAECGADAVKFQTFRTRLFVSPRDRARFERLSSFELTGRDFEDLAALARSLGLLFISTPLDLESARFLDGLVDCYKVASGDNDFYPLLETIAATGKSVIVSSGMSDLAQVKQSQACLEAAWDRRGRRGELAVLHCLSSYPAPPDQVHLAAMPMLGRELGCTVGYSDHTLGIEACLTAVALGARIIEKHFTLDKNFSDFRDHKLSADPAELAELVRRIPEVVALVGTADKQVQPAEVETARVARRSIVAAADLGAGHRITAGDLMWIRPAGGLPPGQEGRLLGKTLRRAVAFAEQILPGDVTD